ncbi:MAG: extracellular solute-binding protein [Pseudomonadota bacterium]
MARQRTGPFLCLLLSIFLVLPAWAGSTLRVLAWPGYADADLIRQFEQRTGSRVELTVIGSDEALWQKIAQDQGRHFDVFAVNTAELQRYIAHGLATPVDTTALPQLARRLPRFRDLGAIPGLVHRGAVYGIPYTYAEMGLIYDRSQVKAPPRSIAALWDPNLRGKVLAYSGAVHNFSLAAQSLGRAAPFRIAEADWPVLVDRLIALRRNVLTFYTQPEESVDLFIRRKAALMFANYGSQQVRLLRAAGVDVGYAIPEEGALAWLDCWAITPGAGDRKLAHAWIDYMLEPGPGQALVERQGLANTLSESPYPRSGDRLRWLEPVEDTERRTRYWRRIQSGDRAAKVLAP